MPEYDEDDDWTDDESDDEADQQPERSGREWAELRRAKKARQRAEKELAEMKKQVAFSKAGIDVDDPKSNYFVKGYEGEMTVEAIKAEAIKAGFLTVPTDDPNPPDVLAQQAITDAASGATPEGGSGVSTAAIDQAFVEGGTDGMLAYLRESGIPINEVQ